MKARYFIILLVVLVAVSSTNVFAQGSSAVAPEDRFQEYKEKMQELGWLIGKWRQEITFEANGRTSTNELHCSWGKTEQSLVQCDTVVNEKVMTRIIYTYDLVSNKHVLNRFDAKTGHIGKGELLKSGDDWNQFMRSSDVGYEEGNPTAIIFGKYSLNVDSSISIERYVGRDANMPEKFYEAKLTKVE